ncbi:DUF4176 domain-containing protein [Pseudogracilibacillus sp. SO30301A]|uniref:DUF4176 domain-containing protein n=1 Tax=Pseudogracilibacillus sp. SO30301A TaxID=3098291 RepID=UPI00300DE4B1
MKQKVIDLALKKVEQIIQKRSQDLDTESIPIIKGFFSKYAEDNQFFNHLHQAYKQKLSSIDLHHQQDIITYHNDGTAHSIAFSTKQFELPEDVFVELLSFVIEITREVLPLGTVVELNPTYFKPSEQSEEPTRVVITERFIAPTGYNSYFPYGGIIYPIGEMTKEAKVYFTKPLIKQVVHRGFADNIEDAFVYLMKEEFIVDKNLNSIEFSQDDMKRVDEEMKQKVGEG